MRNQQKQKYGKLTRLFVDTEQLQKPQTGGDREVARAVRSNIAARFKYLPVYILALGSLWILLTSTQSLGDDWLGVAQIVSVPTVILLALLKNRFNNKLLFHSLLAFFGAPLWIMLLTPLIMLFVAFLI